MGRISDDAAAYLASPEYARSQQLLQELGERTDLDRVLFKATTPDVCLAEQDADVGDIFDDDYPVPYGRIIEVTGTKDVRVAEVAETYGNMCSRIIPDDHISVPWKAIVGRTDGIVRVFKDGTFSHDESW